MGLFKHSSNIIYCAFSCNLYLHNTKSLLAGMRWILWLKNWKILISKCIVYKYNIICDFINNSKMYELKTHGFYYYKMYELKTHGFYYYNMYELKTHGFYYYKIYELKTHGFYYYKMYELKTHGFYHYKMYELKTHGFYYYKSECFE